MKKSFHKLIRLIFLINFLDLIISLFFVLVAWKFLFLYEVLLTNNLYSLLLAQHQ
jgi:ABC-type sugar transport system permease subunit